MAPKLLQAAKPATQTVSTPMLALVTIDGQTQISANLITWAGVAKMSRPPEQRAMR